MSALDALPPKMRLLLARSLAHKVHGDALEVCWYEFPAVSNFDTFNREKIREIAEREGLVVYSRGPHVTARGVEWAKTELQRE